MPKLRNLILAGAAFVLLLTTIETAQRYLSVVEAGEAMPWRDALATSLPQWLILALLSLGVLVLARRLPLAGAVLIRNAALHFVLSLLFARLVIAIGRVAVEALLHPAPAWFSRVIGYYLPWYVIFYWGIVAVAHAMRYHQESVQRERAAAELRQMLLTTRLAALRSRLNPHFLFNTLNTISTLALQQRTADIVQATGLLGELLRAGLDDTMPQQIPLAEEVDFAERYLRIQQIRFGERLAFDARVDSDTAHALVPSFLLQPLVENAVVHALTASTRSLRVRLSARKEGDLLHIELHDDGDGPAETIQDGIGLGTTRERLHALYGSEQRFDIAADPEGGTIVTVELPFREAR